VALRPVANAFGGGPEGFAWAGALYGLLLALPWVAIHAATWERPDFQTRANQISFREGVRILARNRSFRQLTGLYICGRITMDVVGAVLIVYFTHVIGRTGDFEWTMGLFIAAVAAALPFWLAVAPRYEKATLFRVGALWWAGSFALLLIASPDWPRWLLLSVAPLGAIGFAAVDLMPWSMIGEVVDEDDLATGERREGLYNGFFMFLRKVGGTFAVLAIGGVLGALGLEPGVPPSEGALLAIRVLASLVPAAFLILALRFARAYPLTRAAHAEILERLAARDRRA
jgi:GPH family glycoside/pentoside/hexuronide:cation symporter